MTDHRQEVIMFLIEQYKDALEEAQAQLSAPVKKMFYNKYNDILQKSQIMDSFHDYLKLKDQIRHVYLQLSSQHFSTYWCSSISSKTHLNYDSQATQYSSYYARTTQSMQQTRIENNYSKEFLSCLCNSDYEFFLTDSGMSSINLALSLCHYFNKSGSFYIQKDIYYEAYPLIKSLFADVKILSMKEIYAALNSDTEIACIFVGYTKLYINDIPLSIQELFTQISQYKNNKTLFVIIDRTFFSLNDNFYEYLVNFNFPPNIIIISVESLLKHYQYGLDIVNMGACFIYSRLCSKYCFSEVSKLLYDALSCRPNPLLCDRVFDFNKMLLKTQFKVAQTNSIMFQHVIDEFSSIPIGMANDSKVEIADVFYIVLPNIEIGEQIIEESISTGCFVAGQSFGFDLTRICCETDFFTRKTFLRVSVGTEDNDDITNKSYIFKGILRQFLC